MSYLSNSNSKKSKNVNSLIQKYKFIAPKFLKSEINKWRKNVDQSDRNYNGLNDLLEQKLDGILESNKKNEKYKEDFLSKREILSKEDILKRAFGQNKKSIESLSYDHIPLIIYFPAGDINSLFSLFENLGGEIESKYTFSINGFAGNIDYKGLSLFCEILESQNVPYIVEEDSIIEANLYYNSINMNLRPYVWNTLSYTGDDQSSIAIIDTGIDDSHNFFQPGYSSGNFNYKLVGWRDEINGLTSPYDDAGHGSHCAGISSGEGSPTLDGNGRTVSTYSLGLDLTGYMVPVQTIYITAARFNVTEPGVVEVQCEFTDYTPGSDAVHIYPYLYREETVVDSYITSSSSWSHTLSYTATASTLGDYSLRIDWVFDDNTGDGYVYDPHFRFRGEIHWPFNPPLFGSGDPWKGVASDAHLVGVKVLNSEGSGTTSGVLNGINWAISNRVAYHITTMSLSLGGSPGQTSIINAVNNAVNNGIVTVVAAGNSGAPGNNIGSPGDADNVITVAAMSQTDHVTDYSSSGGSSYTGNTIKPDIMAPGGSYYKFLTFSTDTNDNDASGEYSSDGFLNDLYPALGTSMSTPAVAGASNLIIDAMGGHSNWGYTGTEAKRVKALLLMSATETYPLTREITTSFSPSLNRGGKDIHEGYGRTNIDVALEAVSQELTLSSTQSAWLTSSLINPFKKHGLGCYVDLNGGDDYYFTLKVPSGADFDLHLYSDTPSSIGEPIMVASSTSPGIGVNEIFNYIPATSGKYYLIAKAISGEGLAQIFCRTNQFTPTLSNGLVNPSSGNQTTQFNFSVVYTDLDDNPPASINVWINGTPYPMEQQNVLDDNYTDGCSFQSLVYLQPGTYNYQFKCDDGKFNNSTIIFTGINVTGINSFQPILTGGIVNPSEGSAQTTTFAFSVTYSDVDNNAPDFINITINSTTYSMVQQNPLDTNYMDGCIYIFSTTLDEGSYNFYFNCSDGVFQNNLGPFIGPVVKLAIKVAILESIGTQPANVGLWDDLNINWPNYGPRQLIIDYISLNKPAISYTDLINSQADVIVLPNAWGSYDYTPDEVSAIIQYVKSGRGVVATASTFYSAPNNLQLAPIFGMDSSMSTSMVTQFNQLEIDPLSTGIGSSTLFYNLSSPLESYMGYTLSGWRLNLSDPGILAATYIGAPVQILSSVFTGAAVIYHQSGLTGQGRAIYCTHLDIFDYGSSWTVNETQLYYNALLYASGVDIPNSAPTLSSGSVVPATGDQMTQFNFSVTYTDLDNNPPQYINVLINGTPHSMEKQNLLDTNYTDGCVYQYLTFLQPGNYNFSFECADWKSSNSTDVYTGLNVIETNVNPPLLSSGQVNPITGYENITTFIFSVNYTDIDNNAPDYVTVTINSTVYSMNKQDILDEYYLDGCIFNFSTTLNDGIYEFYFNCSDGTYQNSAGPYIGPNVEAIIFFNQTRLDGVQIGTVITHGEDNPRTIYPNLITDLTQRGATVSDITSTITSSLLSNYNIIWFDEYGSSMTINELNAIEQWVDSGGKFIITGDNMGSAIGLAQRYNINYGSSAGGGTTNIIYPHPITIGVTQVTFPSPMSSLDISLQPNADLCVELNSYDMVVAMRSGAGGFVIIVDEDVLTSYTSADNHLLFNNSFGWLASLENQYQPTLTAESVNPLSGNQSTQFTFSVLYTDLDNNLPQYINVLINGTPYQMEKQNPLDIVYSDGCIYQFLTYLQPGVYSYSFECFDGLFYESTITHTGLVVNEVNTAQPELINPQVNPEIGDDSTIFNFTVLYYDADNNFPNFIEITINTTTYSMLSSIPFDQNVMDGKSYYFNTSLDFGFYQFQINCSDGTYTNSTGWNIGPEVTPFSKGGNITLFNDDFENGLSKWETITGLWHLTDTSSTWPNPCHSPIHSMWFGQESTGNYDTGNREMGEMISIPIDLSAVDQAYLEFYHWREGEAGWDYSYVYISVNGISWNLLYQSDAMISPWEKLTFNISQYCGYSSVKIRFYFDTQDGLFNNFRGWLVDDVIVYSNKSNPIVELLMPNNNSSVFNGWINFNWSSLELAFGTVNYTLQISNLSDFSNIIYELENIVETPTITSVFLSIEFPSGQYYWRVCPTYGPFKGNWSNYFTFNLILNDYVPSLISGKVIPSTGDQFTQFNFSVIYSDQDNNSPFSINVLINGIPYAMVKQDIFDFDYTDGCIYQYLTYLSPAIYNYSFLCSDGKFTNSTGIYVGLMVNESNIFTPQLLNPLVSPDIGNNSTLFIFTVTYLDFDNNFPIYVNITIDTLTYSMLPVNPSDFNVMDGKDYYFITTLNYGIYQFLISCSDFSFTNSTSWINGPEVNPFYGLSMGSIVINEIYAGAPDYIELYNYGSDMDMTGWSIQIYDADLLDATYYFPNGWIFRSNFVVVVHENSGTNTDTDLYTGWNIMWHDRTIAAGLFDDSSAHVDWLQTSTFTGSRPGDVEWVQDVGLVINQNYAYRTSDFDTNKASDWTVSSLGSPGSLNPGQTGTGSYSLNLLSPSNGSTLFSGLIDFRWTSLEPYFGPVNYTLQISNFSDFSNITHEIEKITETPSISNISLLVNYSPGQYYWRVCPTYGLFNGEWCSYFTFTIQQNIFAPNISSGSVDPNNGNQFTLFTYNVIYTDQDNNPPTSINIIIDGIPYMMSKQNPLDSNYMDGCNFIYQTNLNPGVHTFSFNCYDGIFSANDGPYSGPNVEELDILNNYRMIPGYSYTWIDATVGTRCNLDGMDDSSQLISLPFTFPFYDGEFNSIWVCTNGFASFVGYTSFINVPFPTSSYYNMIAPYWDDLRAANPCNIYYRTLSSPNRFVIEWKDIYSFGGSMVGSFEIILYETGDIIFSYDYLDYASSYTCGLNYGYDTYYYNSYTGLTTSTNDFSIYFEYGTGTPPEDPPDEQPIFDPKILAALSLISDFNFNIGPIVVLLIIVFSILIGGIILGRIYSRNNVTEEPSISRQSKRTWDPKFIGRVKSSKATYTFAQRKKEVKNIEKANIFKRMAEVFRESKNYQRAIDYYEKAANLNPFDRETKFILNQLRTALKSAEGGNVIITPPPKVLVTPPPEQKRENWYIMGLRVFDEGEYEYALQYFKKEIEINPNSREAWSKMGITYGRLKNYQKMVECYKKVIEIDQSNEKSYPKSDLSKINLIKNENLMKSKKPQIKQVLTPKSEQITQKSILLTLDEPEKRKSTAKNCYVKGFEFLLLKNYNKAINYFTKAIKIDPEFKEAWFELGKCYSKTGNLQKVIDCNLKAIVIDPKLKNAWNFLAATYLASGNYHRAIKCYEKVVEIDPKLKNVWNILGLFSYYYKDYEKAIGIYKKVLDIDLYDKETWSKIAKCYGKLGDHQKVIDCCKKAVKIDPLDKRGWYNLGVAYLNLKNYNKSFQSFTNANKIDPQDEKIIEILNSLNNKISNNEKNITLKFEQKPIFTEEMLDEDVKKWYKMGNLFFHLQSYKKAIDFYKKVIAKYPQFKDAVYRISISYGRLGNLPKMIEYGKKAKNINLSNNR
ncbi:MAG: tetratricopeptide repeat protein [Candidatus Helarchaeota archaeon]|nr:tetratricopeptide repeat protein [Candidatus Helarchaeota archaeon]